MADHDLAPVLEFFSETSGVSPNYDLPSDLAPVLEFFSETPGVSPNYDLPRDMDVASVLGLLGNAPAVDPLEGVFVDIGEVTGLVRTESGTPSGSYRTIPRLRRSKP